MAVECRLCERERSNSQKRARLESNEKQGHQRCAATVFAWIASLCSQRRTGKRNRLVLECAFVKNAGIVTKLKKQTACTAKRL